MNRYTPTQVGRYLGFSRQTVLNRIHAGAIKAYRAPFSNRFYVLPEDLKNYAQENGLPLFPLPQKAEGTEQKANV